MSSFEISFPDIAKAQATYASTSIDFIAAKLREEKYVEQYVPIAEPPAVNFAHCGVFEGLELGG
jgi:hypothetical protein